MAQPAEKLSAVDLWPIAKKLPRDEQVQLARLLLRGDAARRTDAEAYAAAPPTEDELSSDEDALAWEGKAGRSSMRRGEIRWYLFAAPCALPGRSISSFGAEQRAVRCGPERRRRGDDAHGQEFGRYCHRRLAGAAQPPSPSVKLLGLDALASREFGQVQAAPLTPPHPLNPFRSRRHGYLLGHNFEDPVTMTTLVGRLRPFTRLEPRPGEAPAVAQELPNGRGFLRPVGGGESGAPRTAPKPVLVPRQLDLFDLNPEGEK